ncbi:inorganic triphosphatase YgiF [Novosphingobium chloroacetimidivorans]|uniref:Inorganic triphosphatase YgiF n=1 Tax=Novosphingobium chloroacetimidivorans TaxID=1428314 RepID=A0A7W7NWP4_9SPHN|nr:CHAD domain-containing protein [Novosphingobium chloroacetimidivorans]MBB4858307.1 inorganic triphosphatase YgiF [Novosphingobium chloroacetimidivorans]
MLEVELKLEVSEAAAEQLKASPLLAGEHDCSALRAIYFDTPDRAVVDAGFSLRIRSKGEQRTQTIKADGPASVGLFMRSEWEMPVNDTVPVLDHATPLAALLGDRAEQVAPVFEVDVERCTWMLHEDDAEIEVVLDRGQVHAGGRGELICELELELKSGEPAALFAFARKLDTLAPVRIGVLSKSERGYRLTRPSQSSYKAEAVKLDPEASAAAAFQAIAQSCLRQFRLNEALLVEHRHAKPLHQARVALRRLRSAFSLFKGLYAQDARAAALREDLRALAGTLGEARNLDVLLGRASQGDLRARLQIAREEAYSHVEDALDAPWSRSLMLDLMEWLTDGGWLKEASTQDARDEPVRDFAARALDRARRKVKKGGRHLARLDDHARHELRKDAKKLRYDSEFFAGLYDRKRSRRRHKRFIAALEDLQDQLGLLNDLATAPEEIRKLGLEDVPEAQALLGHDTKPHLIKAAAEAHEGLVDAKRFWR